MAESTIQHRRGFLHRLARSFLRGLLRRVVCRAAATRCQHRLENAEHAAGARRGVFLPIAQVLGREPRRWRFVLQRRRFVLERREHTGVQNQFALVARHGVQHGHRIAQLLPGALQFGQRGVDAPMGVFALQAPQAAAGIAQGLPGAFQKVVHGSQPVGAGLLLRRAFLGGGLLDEEALLGGQVDAVARFRHEHPLAGGQRFEVRAEAQRLGARALLRHLAEQLAHLIAHTALIVDQSIQPPLELVAFVQLVGELQDPPRDQLQVDAGVVVAGGGQAHRVVEPRRALPQQVDDFLQRRLLLAIFRGRLGGIGVGGKIRLRGQRQP